MLIKKDIEAEGIYIELETSDITKKIIKSFAEDLKKKFDENFNIDDKTINESHVTLIYSKKKFKGIIEVPFTKISAKVIGFKKFDNPKEDIYALALKLNCKKCKDLHNYLMKKYDFRYDYDEYIPHLTISYKAKDITQEMLDSIEKEYREKNKFPYLIFNKINIEPLNENWADDKK